MSNKKDFDETVKGIAGAVGAADESYAVDDIINDILGADGSYKPDFSEMLSKYHGDAFPENIGEMPVSGRPHRDYAAEADAEIAASRAVDRRIAKKVSPEFRATYERETENAVRPEFTPDGGVRYPSYGVGESEQRVVFDADWETQAKEEAAKMEKMRRGNMLRGDSDYARNFQFSGAEGRGAPKKAADSRLIDPLSDDRDVGAREIYSAEDTDEAKTETKKDEKKAKKPFFGEGFSAEQKINEPADGKTENSDGSEAEESLNEISQQVDGRVLEAFANGLEDNNAFKDEHWQSIVDKAQKRKEDVRREQVRQRSKQRLDEQKQKIAKMEKDIERSPRTDMSIFSNNTGNKFDSIDNENENENKNTGNDADKSETGFVLADDFSADVEKLTPEETESFNPNAVHPDKKIKKTFGEKVQFIIKTHISKEGFKRFAVNVLPQKGDSAGEKVRKIVRSVSFIALVCALVYLLIYYHNYLERIKFIRDKENEISEFDNIPDYELDNAWAEMRKKYPDVDFPEGMNIKFANLYAISRNVVGWLKIENTDISTVLLQTNNDEYYLYRDIYGTYSRYGNPYVKASCSMGREGLSKNTFIYGHNTHDKLIFNRLENYMTVQGYLNAPIITLDTLYEQTKWKIFAVMLTNADPEDDNGNVFNYIYSSFSSEEAFLSKMNEIKARSMIHTGVDVQAGDKTLMLYTCYRNIFSSGRLVIVARQLREGESEDINSSLVYYNNSAIFPQAYYDKKNGVKPTETSTTAAPEPSETSAPATENSTADVTDPVDTTAPEEPGVSAVPDNTLEESVSNILPTVPDVPEAATGENEAA